MRTRSRLLRKRWSNVEERDILVLAQEEGRLDIDTTKIGPVLREMRGSTKVDNDRLNLLLLIIQRSVVLFDQKIPLVLRTTHLPEKIDTLVKKIARASGKNPNEIIRICVAWRLACLMRSGRVMYAQS